MHTGEHSDPGKPLGAVAREARVQLNLTQSDVAELAEVSERFMRDFEKGKSSVRLDKAQTVMAVLGLDIVAIPHIPSHLHANRHDNTGNR